MNDYSVQLYNRDFSQILRPYSLEFTPERISWSAIGGPSEAMIKATGPIIELWEMIERLRCPIEVIAPNKTMIWWGFIESVTIQTKSISVSVSLDQMSNRVCVTYAEVNVAGAVGERKTTTWYENADSIAAYGTKERRLSKSQATQSEAENYAQTQLDRLKYPITKHSFLNADDHSEGNVILTCAGWWKTLGWKYFEFSGGKESFEDIGIGLMALGKGLTSTTISFEAHVDSPKIKDTTEGLLDFSTNETIYVLGSVANNGTYTISSTRDLDAPAGCYLIVEESVVNGAAGPSVTIQGAVKCAQSFQISTIEGWLAASLRIRMKREGSPTDNVVVSLYSDSFGVGTLLASGSLPGTTISENLNWVEISLNAMVFLDPATTYWIVVERDGAIDSKNYYKVDANEDLSYTSGVMKIWNGAAWVDRVPDADMLFQVGGVEEATAQLERILVSGAQFFSAVDVDIDSGVYSSPYRDGDTTALQCVEDLLSSGTTNYRRILANVDFQRRVNLYEEPVSGSKDYYLYSDGSLHDWMGRKINKWDYPVGVWAKLADVIPASADTQKISDPSKVFIEKIVFNIKEDEIYLQERDYVGLMEI
ncbi:MAG: hypothetical protein CVU46_09485 [Chloroflexi bacterium HGW-Chloroflexi-8]|nr:MAG: hypothetical protein CVU46_09485 [Chloroflexi bacterium HGW-Chloroflexi-8]